MGKLSSLFESFDNLDQIDLNSVVSSLKPAPQIIQVENYLANRLLYPQAVPLTEYDMKIDLAILKEALIINTPKLAQGESALLGDSPFINIVLRKILIPEEFINFVPNLASLTYVFVDALLKNRRKEDWYEDLWTVVVTDDADEVVGSVILPQFNSSGGQMEINVLGKTYKIPQGYVTLIPCRKDRCEIAYKLTAGKVLGKDQSALELYGGKLGILVDGRL